MEIGLQSHGFYPATSSLLKSSEQNIGQNVEEKLQETVAPKSLLEKPTAEKSIDRVLEKEDQKQSTSEEVKNIIAQMKARDREVRAHEAAHLAAAGSYAQGGASFTFETGPDGNQYAVAGEVGIDTSAIANDPGATIVKAQQVIRAALAPANPSGQDRSVASQANQMLNTARQALSAERSGSGSEGAEVVNRTSKMEGSAENSLVAQQDDGKSLLPSRNEFSVRLSLQA